MAAENRRNASRKLSHDSQEKEEEDEWQQVNVLPSLVPPGGGPLRSEIPGSMKRTPSRGELLTIVRKHSDGIWKNIANSSSYALGGDSELDSQFWQELFDMFFVRGLVDIKSEKSDQDDDLIFFVRLEGIQHANGRFNESDDSLMQPFFVRRWAPELEKVIGSNAWEVDWCRSFYLDLIAHTSFSLTIAICSRESLQKHHMSSGTSLTPVYKVTKTVYASPSRTNFQPDSKATETVAAYPDICFVVDDFDDTFNEVVLTDVDQCYCVLLNACGGAAFPIEVDEGPADSRTSREARMLGEAPQGSSAPRVTLFSGFVNYDMVHNAFVGGRRQTFEDIFNLGPNVKSEKLIMRGPGGRGEVEVAVSAVPDLANSKQNNGKPPSPTQPGQKLGLGSILHRAAFVASSVARNVAAAAADPKPDGELHPLRCCLMSLSLPWDTVARDLLFKELPKH
ncbi:unnamed protein product [Calypogeia fissa]